MELPAVIEVNNDIFEQLKAFDGNHVHLCTRYIYINHWVNNELELVIPDFALLAGTKQGFYLEQSEEMQALRNNTLQCSYCNAQYRGLISWCTECLGNADISETDLYRLYLRPVNTLDIDLKEKSIRVPKLITERHNVMPELTINGIIINC